ADGCHRAESCEDDATTISQPSNVPLHGIGARHKRRRRPWSENTSGVATIRAVSGLASIRIAGSAAKALGGGPPRAASGSRLVFFGALLVLFGPFIFVCLYFRVLMHQAHFVLLGV